MDKTLSNVILNGAAGAGRHYLFPLLQTIFPAVSVHATCEHIQNTKIWHSHFSRINGLYYEVWDNSYCFNGDLPEKSRCIFLNRDPRDMLLRLHNWFLINYSHLEIIKNCSNFQESFINFLRNGFQWNWMSYDHFVEDIRYFHNLPYGFNVTYEQLAFKPVETLTNLINFMGYPLDTAAIENAVQTIPRTGKVGQWVNFFDDEIEATFKELGGDIVSYLGYEPDENWSYKEYQGKENMTEEEYWNMKPRLLGKEQ